MSNNLSYAKWFKLFNWGERRIADLCRKGSRHMSILASGELGFKVTQCNMLTARRVILHCLQKKAEKAEHKGMSAPHSAP